MRAQLRTAAILSAAFAVVTAAACGRATSISSTSPSAAKCQVTVEGSTISPPAAGANGPPSATASGGGISLAVDTLTGCAWTAVSQTPWIHVTSGASGNAPGTVALSADANTGGARSGIVVIAGQNVTVNQDAAAASPTPTPPAPTPTPPPPAPTPPPPAPTPTPTPCTYAISPTSD